MQGRKAGPRSRRAMWCAKLKSLNLTLRPVIFSSEICGTAGGQVVGCVGWEQEPVGGLCMIQVRSDGGHRSERQGRGRIRRT